MLEKILSKKLELLKEYDYWLELYDRDGLEYQEDRLKVLRYQIQLLDELIEGSE